MILGIGTDIIEIERVAKAIKSEAFMNRVYSSTEVEYCQSHRTQAAASFAGRFAAKEAVLKAFSTGLRNGKLTEIEIVNDDLGCPHVRLSGYFRELFLEQRAKSIFISISHSREFATAQCIIEA